MISVFENKFASIKVNDANYIELWQTMLLCEGNEHT